ncbi:hypothetical protein BS50DRAFT_566847 [Corynespora cassiicola Philippines]|uniref:Uncharacterized protein n=1 Tax=Corynespora cassiicola Philippines TaxID=1448308 RepID=A0A2T2P8M6_CORCC|nr:hypothetical protein BS50DRAFT_566847 [Corynespora cassiicola Philippines]
MPFTGNHIATASPLARTSRSRAANQLWLICLIPRDKTSSLDPSDLTVEATTPHERKPATPANKKLSPSHYQCTPFPKGPTEPAEAGPKQEHPRGVGTRHSD